MSEFNFDDLLDEIQEETPVETEAPQETTETTEALDDLLDDLIAPEDPKPDSKPALDLDSLLEPELLDDTQMPSNDIDIDNHTTNQSEVTSEQAIEKELAELRKPQKRELDFPQETKEYFVDKHKHEREMADIKDIIKAKKAAWNEVRDEWSESGVAVSVCDKRYNVEKALQKLDSTDAAEYEALDNLFDDADFRSDFTTEIDSLENR